ncbi:MAG: ATP-binding protein [Verrucomicrobia bacterium]|nr:ATP-binding protein [Verrucomicrobiota bacterium]
MKRPKYLKDIEMHFRVHSACAILGPRQVGKTTLAKMFLEKDSPGNFYFFDLENPEDLARLENPMLALSKLTSTLIVIDEIQRAPEIFPIIRVLIDDKQKKQKFLILGSASRELIRQSSESLAGRIGYMELMPFSLDEVDHDIDRLWVRGGFPLSYLANHDEESLLWRQSYISTFLERDIPNLGFQIPPQQMRRFWLMLVHYHGQIFNTHELGKSLGISDHMVRKYLDILAGTFMVRILLPWHENLGKRQIKSPKIYFRDSGILHALVGIRNRKEMEIYPKMGSFWEGFALEEIIRQTGASAEECYFWGTHGNAELDLLIMKNGKRIGYEFKYVDAPRITSSMRIACEDLKLDHLYVIYPGSSTFPLSEKITARALSSSINKP